MRMVFTAEGRSDGLCLFDRVLQVLQLHREKFEAQIQMEFEQLQERAVLRASHR